MDTDYQKILLEELIPAMGCTEPIAIALSAAKASRVLQDALGTHAFETNQIEHIEIYCSGNIIKNVMGVCVPRARGNKGILTAAALGLFSTAKILNLEILDSLSEEEVDKALAFLDYNLMKVYHEDTEKTLYIRIEIKHRDHLVSVEIQDDHSKFACIMLDGEYLEENRNLANENIKTTKELSFAGILNYARTAVLTEALVNALERQIKYNFAIAQEGLQRPYGARVGHTILKFTEEDKLSKNIKAYASAASDARMGGSCLPVIINAGSGNQGITVSVPIIVYAKEQNVAEEDLLRALIVANLLNIHQKYYIGKLSAFCGVVSAAAAAGAGIGFLENMSDAEIAGIITNTITSVGGMACDGAKGSCAMKIAQALNTMLLALKMTREGIVFQENEGIVGKDIESTIRNVGRMASQGMRETDKAILEIMTGC